MLLVFILYILPMLVCFLLLTASRYLFEETGRRHNYIESNPLPLHNLELVGLGIVVPILNIFLAVEYTQYLVTDYNNGDITFK